MKKIESKKSFLAIGLLTLVLFAMVGIASAASVVGNQTSPAGNQTSPASNQTSPAGNQSSLAGNQSSRWSWAATTVTGNWDLFFDLSGSGTSYSKAVMTFNSDGTFTDNFGNTGKWTQSTDNGMIIWKYDTTNYVMVYSGNVAGKSMNGIMTEFPSYTGVWYAIQQ